MKNVRQGSFVLLAVIVLAGFLAGCSQSAAPVVRYDQLQGAGTTGIHSVQQGDTVGNIAARYKLDIRDIIVVNAMQAPYKLKVGQRLKLPAPRTYRVRWGDSLYSVSRLFNASVSQIVKMNNLKSPYALSGGQILKLPVVVDAPKPEITISRVDDKNGLPMPSVAQTGVDRQDLSAPQASSPGIAAPAAKMAKPSMAAQVPDKVPPRSGGKFMMPVGGKIISSYGPKAGGLHNDGINIKAPKGAPIRAAENGIVVYAGSELKGYGQMVLIRHADHWMTAYAHMGNTLVKKGAKVKRGDTIGTVGSSGNVDQPQLHFEIRRGTDALNPEKYM